MADLPDVSVDALRRLARGLVFDRHGAEDVVQEAWLAALRTQPAATNLGAWLTGAVRNLAGNRRREEARRTARERSAARPEALPGAGEGAARIEVLRRLLDALERLDQPYRSAVMLRYLEGEPPRAIARRLGVPVNTARTHVRRGLERLRRDLDGERGEGRQDCLAALVPFVGGVPWTLTMPSGGAGGLLMQKKLVLAGSVLVLLGSTYLVARSRSSSPRASSEAATLVGVSPVTLHTDDPPGVAVVDPLPGQREPPAEVARVLGTWVVRGQALRKSGVVFPSLPLLGRVYAGPQPEGRPILEERLNANEAGAFAWGIEPPTELVTVHLAPLVADATLTPTWGVFLPGDAPPEDWVVRAAPLDCTVRGLVRTADGRGVAGALVRERDRADEQETTTDREGRYALRIASGSERRLRVRAAGFAQRTITVDAQEPEDVQAPDFVLAPEQRLRGRIVDEAGQPLEGARVEPSHPFFAVSATSDAQGAFELGTLDLEVEYLSLSARKVGYVVTHQRIDRPQRTKPVELRLARGVRVTGRVLDPDGAPVWGAWVSIGDWPWRDQRIEAYSDREGRFTLETVPSGPQTAWLWRSGFAQGRVEVDIPTGIEEHALELRLEPGHFVGGTVLDEAGAPLPWVFVYADDPGVGRGQDAIEGFQSYTGADGRFRFEGLPAMPVTVGAVSEGRARVELVVPELDRDDVVLHMRRSAGFAGTVIDALSGQAIPSFVVRVGLVPRLEFQGLPAAWTNGVSFLDPDGRWRLEGEFDPDQVASLTIEAPRHAPATLVARSAVDADPANLVVALPASTRVHGRVLERASGAPIAGARVRRCTDTTPYEWLDRTSEPVKEASTDAAGRFELVDVPTGPMGLAIEHPDWTTVLDGPFEVVGAAPIERWIELGQGARVRGRLLDEQGTALAGETVSIYGLDGAERTRTRASTTDAEGSFLLAGLASGLYHLRWERVRGEVRVFDLVQRVELAPDDELELDLRPQGRATLTGTVECAEELPELAGVMVVPRPEREPDGSFPQWARSLRATFAERGRFTLTGLSAGPHTVSMHLQLASGLYLMGSVHVEVPDEGAVDVRIRLERRR